MATQMYMSNVRIIVNLCMSDLFDRHPKLKVVSAESGIISPSLLPLRIARQTSAAGVCPFSEGNHNSGIVCC